MKIIESKCFILMIYAFLNSACNQTESTENQLPVVKIAKVKLLTLLPQTWQQSIETYGVVEASEELNLSVSFSETVSELLFKEGQKVNKGQVLIRLNKQKRLLQVEKARTEVTAAKAAVEKASSILERRQQLAKIQNLSKEALQSAEIQKRSSTSRYQETLALLKIAELELADCTVFSPVNGVIDKQIIEQGEITVAGQTLATIQTLDRIRIRLYVSEKDINYLVTGQSAELSFPAIPKLQLTAEIESLGVKADSNTSNFPVTLKLANTDGLLRAGMSVRIRLKGQKINNTLLIPEQAIVDRNRQKVVFLMSENKAKRVQPLFKASISNWVPVLAGLKAGDQLIIKGQDNLIDGSSVELIAD